MVAVEGGVSGGCFDRVTEQAAVRLLFWTAEPLAGRAVDCGWLSRLTTETDDYEENDIWLFKPSPVGVQKSRNTIFIKGQ